MYGRAVLLLPLETVLRVTMAQLVLLLSHMQFAFHHFLVQSLKLVPVALLDLSGVLFKTNVSDEQWVVVRSDSIFVQQKIFVNQQDSHVLSHVAIVRS